MRDKAHRAALVFGFEILLLGSFACSIISSGGGVASPAAESSAVSNPTNPQNTQSTTPLHLKLGGPISVDGGPRALLFAGKYLWAAIEEKDSVLAIDPELAKVIFSVPLADGPDNLAFDGKLIWAVVGSAVQSVDPETRKASEPIPVSLGTGSRSPVDHLAFDGSRLWITNARETIQPLDLSTGVLGNPVSAMQWPEYLLFDGTRLWVSSYTENVVYAIDPTSEQLVTTISLGENIQTGGPMAFDGTRLWVASEYDSVLVGVDPVSGQVGEPIEIGHRPDDLLFDGARLWVVSVGENPDYVGVVQAIDIGTGQRSAPLEPGHGSESLAFDGERIWVANLADDTVVPILIAPK